MKIVIYWTTKETEKINRVMDKFNITPYVSVNGETPAEISDEQIELLKEVEKRGFIKIRTKHVL